MKSEDPEIERLLRECEEPQSERVRLVLGLVGAFLAGAVVFVGVVRAAKGPGFSIGALVLALVFLSIAMRRKRK